MICSISAPKDLGGTLTISVYLYEKASGGAPFGHASALVTVSPNQAASCNVDNGAQPIGVHSLGHIKLQIVAIEPTITGKV